jgi:hypothetical protein
MGIGTGIFLIAIGAALSWAIDVDLPYVEDDAVGRSRRARSQARDRKPRDGSALNSVCRDYGTSVQPTSNIDKHAARGGEWRCHERAVAILRI